MKPNFSQIPTLSFGFVVLIFGSTSALRAQESGGVTITQSGTGTGILSGSTVYSPVSVSGNDRGNGAGGILPSGSGALFDSGTVSGSVTSGSPEGGTVGGSGTTGLGTGDPISVSGPGGGSGTVDTLTTIILANQTFDVQSTSASIELNLLFESGSSLQTAIDSSTNAIGTIEVVDDVILDDPDLIVTDLATSPKSIPVGTVFDVLSYGGSETGEFAVDGTDIPEDGTFRADGSIFKLDYAAGNKITLTDVAAVPEPSSWAMLSGGLGLLAFWHRSRRMMACRQLS
jgi:hypothetical protein